MDGIEALCEKPYDPDSFALDILRICGAAKATLKKLSDGTSNKAQGLLGDTLLQKKLYFRPSAQGQTGNDLTALAVDPLTKKYKPRLLIACDGQEVSILDTKKGTPTHFAWKDLPKIADFFWPLAGHEVYEGHEETKADRDAAYALSKLYDAIIAENPDWENENRQHDLNIVMTRLLFCMFAEDTGIFDDHLFTRCIADYTADSGGDVHRYLEKLFEHLNISDSDRENTPDWLNGFHYVNGGLFKDKTDIPRFSKRARRYLIDAAELDWADINPDIFGTMIQAVVAPKMRGDLGMHYTSVENIMKVIHPLFLMSLEEDFDKAKDSPKKLDELLTRLSKIRVFDPACGSGNFLIIAYQKLRELEMQVFQRLEELSGNRMFGFSETGFSRISLDNFYGIELADFAAETAKLSLWIAEYQMNQKFKTTFGDAPPDLPLRDGGHIVTGNALRVDWLIACPPPIDKIIETYICGNPPYLGSSMQDKEQKADLASIFEPHTKKYKNLDIVTAWYLKAAMYSETVMAKSAFVATNSICQGEQAAMLWPLIFNFGNEIKFAHLSFKWKNLAKKNAAVICVIVGIGLKSSDQKTLFTKSTRRHVSNIGPYLIEGPNIVIPRTGKPITERPRMVKGNQASDGGNLILSKEDTKAIIDKTPAAKQFIKKYYGSQEFLKGINRWCLWIEDHELGEASKINVINERIQQAIAWRSNAKAPSTRARASSAHRFIQIQDYGKQCILIPRVSSERRNILPVGFFDQDTIINDAALAIYDPEIWLFSILSSSVHLAWIRTVCGKLKTDYRYSNTLGYNTFPIPDLSHIQKQLLEEHAWKIIEAREAHPGKTIAWLYHPDTMPENLLAAHRALDDTLEKIYIGRPFENDTERLEHLFKLYAKITKKKAAS